MRYLIAPNAFKGTISATEAAKIIADQIEQLAGSECQIQPVADGGDGTCSLLIESLGLERVFVPALNAVGQPILGYFGWAPSTQKAYIDVSTVSGIGSLESTQRDPFTSSTYGTGLLIRKAVETGAQEIVLGLGGSATVDLGIGILGALGVLFLDGNGRELTVFSPQFLGAIRYIQMTPNLPKVKFTCLCDVRNPFFGELGAVQVFGPQKGIPVEELDLYDRNCKKILELLINKTRKEWIDASGFGAAGGIAMGLDFFFPTEIKFGAAYFFDLVGVQKKIVNSDWIITGEGQYDSQSDQGKASFGLLRLARNYGKKIALITSGQEGRNAGFDLVLELPGLDFSSADYKEKARQNLDRLIGTAILEGKFF